MRQAQSLDTEQPFIVLVADNSPKVGQLELVLHGKTAATLPTAVAAPNSNSTGNKSVGVIVYGPKKTFDRVAAFKARSKGSGQDIDVLWAHRKDHHACIETLVNLLHEADEPILSFMSRVCELEITNPNAVPEHHAVDIDTIVHSIQGRGRNKGNDDEHEPLASERDSVDGEVSEHEEEHAIDPNANDHEKHANETRAPLALQTEGGVKDDEVANENVKASKKQKPVDPPNPNNGVPNPAIGASQETTRINGEQKFKDENVEQAVVPPSSTSASGSVLPPSAKSTVVTKTTAAKGPKASKPAKPIVPNPAIEGAASTPPLTNGESPAKHDGAGHAMDTNGVPGEEGTHEEGLEKEEH